MIKQLQTGDISLPVFLTNLAGVFIILGSLGTLAMLLLYGSSIIMGGPWHMYYITNSYWLTVFLASISLFVGGLIVYSSRKMGKQPENKVWAIMVILGSLIALFYLGGFGLGGILGLAGVVVGRWT